MKIFVGGLPFRVDDSSLKEAFQEYGEVSSAKVITDKFTGDSRGFGFVEMPSDDSANKAIAELDKSKWDNRNINVSLAKPKEERSNNNRSFAPKSNGGYNNRY